MPPQPIQDVRDLTRTRRELTREIVRHTQRIQATLEEANIKVTSVISDILGLSGRRILKAIVGGEGDPTVLAGFVILGLPVRMRNSSPHWMDACATIIAFSLGNT